MFRSRAPSPQASDLSELGAQRRITAWTLLLALGLLAALAAPFFLGRVYIADDLGEFHLPLRNFYAEQLGRGESFDWMPSLYGGIFVSAEGQLGGYHPLHYLLYRWLPLGAAFDLELLVSYPLMFAGMYLLLRRVIGRRDAASFGALVFTFGGFNLLHFVHPNAIAIVAHIPWLLWAIDVALTAIDRRTRAAAEAGVALLTASQLLLGYPQYVWFSLLIVAAYAVWRAARLSTPWRLMPLAWAEILGLLVGALQLLPTWHALANSARQTPDAEFANTGSLHPLNLVQLVAPYLFETRVVGQNTHELGLYIGVVPLVLCVWLLAQRASWGTHRSLVRAALVFGTGALLLAAGQYGGLYRLQLLLPLVDRFRFPCRGIVLVQLCLATLAAVGWALLVSRRTAERRGLRPLAATLAVSVILAAMAPFAWPEYVAGNLLVWTGPVLVALAVGLVVLAEQGRRWAPIGLVALTAIDLGTYGLSYSIYNRTADLHTFVADISLPPGGAHARVSLPHGPRSRKTGDRMVLAGLQRVDGYAGLEPARQLDHTTQETRQLAGVEWVWQRDPSDDASKSQWLPVSPTAPRARIVTQVTRSCFKTSADDGTRATAGLPSSANRRKTLPDKPAVAPETGETVQPSLETTIVDSQLSLPGGVPGSVNVLSDKPGRIVIETDAAGEQLLVTTESFDSGWRAIVDGHSGPALRVNGDFLGCVVPAGVHQVELSFQPPSLHAGVWTAAVGLLLIMGTFCLRAVGRKRGPDADQTSAASMSAREDLAVTV